LSALGAAQNTLTFEFDSVSHGHLTYDAGDNPISVTSRGYDFTTSAVIPTPPLPVPDIVSF